MIPIKSPVVLPSGHTIEKCVMEQFIERKDNDPFDNSKKCEQIVFNRFFDNVKELYNQLVELNNNQKCETDLNDSESDKKLDHKSENQHNQENDKNI